MTELRIYHLFVVYLILRIMSFSIFWSKIKFCLLWKILTKRGTRKKRSIFSCVTVLGNRARQAIMIHNFAKDENGSFEKPLSTGRFTTVLEVIYQTRGRVFHPISKHREVVEKTRRSRVFFNQLQGVWISDETPFRMFDIASQTINNSWRKSKQKFTRFYDN